MGCNSSLGQRLPILTFHTAQGRAQVTKGRAYIRPLLPHLEQGVQEQVQIVSQVRGTERVHSIDIVR